MKHISIDQWFVGKNRYGHIVTAADVQYLSVEEENNFMVGLIVVKY